MTRRELGYRLPDECCAMCSHAYVNNYGDFQCNLMTGVVITEGAVCDHYMYDSTLDIVAAIEAEVTPPPWEPTIETCDGCANLTGDLCIFTMTKATTKCKRFEVVMDTELDCAHCKYSYWGDVGAMCAKTSMAIEPESYCDMWEWE